VGLRVVLMAVLMARRMMLKGYGPTL